jgi:hypothetical protein
MILTAAQLAAIAAGASAEAVMAAASVVDPTPEQLAATAAAEAETVRLAAEAAAATEAAATAAQVAADTAAALAAASVPNPVVAHLTAQLTEAQTSLVAAKVEAASYKAAAEAQDGLLAIVREALSNKNIALGGSSAAADTFTAGNIAAEYARVDGIFKSKFKIGGVAVAAAAGEKKTHVDPLFAAAVQASNLK